MHGKTIKPDPFKRMQGADVTAEWLETDPTAMTEPIVIEKPDGLGMEMPEDLTVADVAEIVGADTPVEVIGTSSHVYAYAFTEVTSGPSSTPRLQMWRHRATSQGGPLGNGQNTTAQSPRSGKRFATSSRSRSRARSSRAGFSHPGSCATSTG